MKRNALLSAGAVVLLAIAGGSLVGCPGGNGGRVATVKQGEMPSGESWMGVYYHPVFGYLHMQENSSSVVGKWRREDQSAWGELSGTVTGNLVHFAWQEHKYGLVGPSADSKGKGYFVYKMGANNTPELDGQYGVGDDEVGGDWHNIKQTGKKPDLNSISGDMKGLAPNSGGKWE